MTLDIVIMSHVRLPHSALNTRHIRMSNSTHNSLNQFYHHSFFLVQFLFIYQCTDKLTPYTRKKFQQIIDILSYIKNTNYEKNDLILFNRFPLFPDNLFLYFFNKSRILYSDTS